MNRAALARQLRRIREGAPHKQMSVGTHLFGIEYADELRDYSLEQPKKIMFLAGTPASIATDIKKCIKLAEHVTVNREARTR